MSVKKLRDLRATHPTLRRRRLWRLPVILVIGLALVGGTVLSSHHTATAVAITDRIGAAQQALSQDAAANAALRATIADTQAQEAVLQEAITALDAQITTTDNQVSAAQAQLNAIAASLLTAQRSLASTQAALAVDRTQLRDELVVLYKAQNASNSFSNFLNSGDFNSFWQRVLDLHRLAADENRLVGRVTGEQAAIGAQVAAITVQKQGQATLVATLHGLAQQLNQTLATRRQAQANLAAKQSADHVLLIQNQLAQAQVQAQIAQLKAEEAAALAAGGGHGQFAWPETGPITQNFGCTTYPFEPYDPNCATLHFHSGVDIAAPCGNNINAADSGIAHTYYSSFGYGNHVLIDHGNGFVSLYGHMSAFSVGDGQTVHRGQLIGYEGSTGNSTGCHLHFEIDLNGTPRNPLSYLS